MEESKFRSHYILKLLIFSTEFSPGLEVHSSSSPSGKLVPFLSIIFIVHLSFIAVLSGEVGEGRTHIRF